MYRCDCCNSQRESLDSSALLLHIHHRNTHCKSETLKYMYVFICSLHIREKPFNTGGRGGGHENWGK